MKNFIVKNIGRLVTCEPGKGREGLLGLIQQGAVVVKNGKIDWVGPADDLPKISKNNFKTIDAKGGVLLPGLVECHTHLVHAGTREHEFALRAQGVSYEEIAKQGGGILSTVRSTRKASVNQLYQESLARADEALAHGITTLEIKTGYGLDTATELKMIAVIEKLAKNHPLGIVGTFLGAHFVPAEFKQNRKQYIDLVIHEMLPKVVKKKVIQFIDVFVEGIAFTKGEALQVIAAGKKWGLKPRLHVDQLQEGGGAAFAAQVGAVSADHLDYISDAGIAALKKAGTVAVLLPGATFFLKSSHYPPARKLISAGVLVAISTDYNPGTNPSLDPWFLGTLAATQMKMSIEEVILGLTKIPALSLGLEKTCGSIAPGKNADLVLLDCENETIPFYRYGKKFVKTVWKNGTICFYRRP